MSIHTIVLNYVYVLEFILDIIIIIVDIDEYIILLIHHAPIYQH